MLTIEYVAGFFDGEGCVSCREGVQHGVRVVTGEIQIANTHEGIIRQIAQQFGGSYRQAQLGRLGKHKVWTWRLTGKKAEDFATLIAPHCVLKREQLELFLELRRTITHGGRRSIPPEVWDRRRDLLARIKAAKRTHLVTA